MKPCPDCGQWVERLPDGRTYNDNGKFHSETCIPNRNWKKKNKLERAEWEAKNLIRIEDKKEDRGFRRIFNSRGFNG